MTFYEAYQIYYVAKKLEGDSRRNLFNIIIMAGYDLNEFFQMDYAAELAPSLIGCAFTRQQWHKYFPNVFLYKMMECHRMVYEEFDGERLYTIIDFYMDM